MYVDMEKWLRKKFTIEEVNLLEVGINLVKYNG